MRRSWKSVHATASFWQEKTVIEPGGNGPVDGDKLGAMPTGDWETELS